MSPQNLPCDGVAALVELLGGLGHVVLGHWEDGRVGGTDVVAGVTQLCQRHEAQRVELVPAEPLKQTVLHVDLQLSTDT